MVCKGDLQLIINFMMDTYVPKNMQLYVAIQEVKQLIWDAKLRVIFKHVPRDKNVLADGLCNASLNLQQDVLLKDVEGALIEKQAILEADMVYFSNTLIGGCSICGQDHESELWAYERYE